MSSAVPLFFLAMFAFIGFLFLAISALKNKKPLRLVILLIVFSPLCFFIINLVSKWMR